MSAGEFRGVLGHKTEIQPIRRGAAAIVASISRTPRLAGEDDGGQVEPDGHGEEEAEGRSQGESKAENKAKPSQKKKRRSTSIERGSRK